MPGQGSNTQMKFMMYGMPVIFFFVLYNMPSGLTVYWIFSNFLSLAQQLIINRINKNKRAELEAQMAAKEAAKNVIAPPKKKRKK
jgi:YidC/Oxa1 family membrane protein insertase